MTAQSLDTQLLRHVAYGVFQSASRVISHGSLPRRAEFNEAYPAILRVNKIFPRQCNATEQASKNINPFMTAAIVWLEI